MSVASGGIYFATNRLGKYPHTLATSTSVNNCYVQCNRRQESANLTHPKKKQQTIKTEHVESRVSIIHMWVYSVSCRDGTSLCKIKKKKKERKRKDSFLRSLISYCTMVPSDSRFSSIIHFTDKPGRAFPPRCH